MSEQKEIKIFYDPDLNEKQRDDFVKGEIKKLEDQGYKIIMFESMERIISISIGLRLLVEKGE